MTTAVDRRIAQVARRQGGHISRTQLLDVGLSRAAIQRRIDRGLLIAVHPGVYAVGHLPTHPLERAKGALLACGPHAALSHRSAATLWGIETRWWLPFDVITSDHRRPGGVRSHRAAWLTRLDIRIHLGVRATCPALTLLHVANRMNDPRRLARAVNDLRLARRLTIEEVEGVVARFPRHSGARHLRRIIAAGQPEPTRSALEDRFQEFASTHALPPYELNVVVCGHRVDVLFPEERLVVELDGFEVHRTRQAFERDRAQDADILERAGIPTVRITHARMHRHGDAEAARLRRILASRSRLPTGPGGRYTPEGAALGSGAAS